MAAERLQKILARAGIASRRASEEFIQQGRVTVNGKVASLGMSADPNSDDIRLDGERLTLPETHEYIMLNKPKGVISDEDVRGEHDNARDLIPIGGHLYPVGRLDLDSEGLMLFTNDGELAHKLTHPRYEHPKTYRVLVDGSPSEEVLDQWRNGVWLEGRPTYPAEVRKVIKTRRGTILDVTLREGRKRQIRKVAAKLGHPVIGLVRTGLGPLSLGDLPVGAWRRLTDDEVAALRKVRQTRARVRRPAAQSRDRRPRRDDDRPLRQGRPSERRGEKRRPVGRGGRERGSARLAQRDRSERDDREPRERAERTTGAERPHRRDQSSRETDSARSERPGRDRAEGRERPRREQSERTRRSGPSDEAQRPRRRTRQEDSTKPPRPRRPQPRPTGRPDRPKRQAPRRKPKRGAER